MNIYGQRWAVDGAVWHYGYKPGITPDEAGKLTGLGLCY